MGEERPRKAWSDLEKLFGFEYPLYKGKDRSNLELQLNRFTAQAIRYSQTGMAVSAFGVASLAFLFYVLDRFGWIGFEGFGWIGVLIWSFVFLVFLAIAVKRFFYSWAYSIKAAFIERKLGFNYTWDKYKLKDKLDEFTAKRRFYRITIKIYSKKIINKITKYIP